MVGALSACVRVPSSSGREDEGEEWSNQDAVLATHRWRGSAARSSLRSRGANEARQAHKTHSNWFQGLCEASSSRLGLSPSVAVGLAVFPNINTQRKMSSSPPPAWIFQTLNFSTGLKSLLVCLRCHSQALEGEAAFSGFIFSSASTPTAQAVRLKEV